MDPPDTTENHFRTDNLTSVSNFYQQDFRTDNLTSVSDFYQYDFMGQERIPTHSLWSVLKINRRDKSQTEFESGPKDQLSCVVGEFSLSSIACFFFPMSRFVLLK